MRELIPLNRYIGEIMIIQNMKQINYLSDSLSKTREITIK